MGLRETLEKRRGVASAFGFAAIALAVFLIVIESRSSRLTKIDRAFYSDDDGQTYFVDSVDKLFPFDHNGRQAYRAYVFRCSDGTEFVGYLARYTDSTKARLAELMAQPYNQVAQQIADAESAGTEIKKPGDSRWYPQASPQAAAMLMPTCPNGGTLVGGVMP